MIAAIDWRVDDDYWVYHQVHAQFLRMYFPHHIALTTSRVAIQSLYFKPDSLHLLFLIYQLWLFCQNILYYHTIREFSRNSTHFYHLYILYLLLHNLYRNSISIHVFTNAIYWHSLRLELPTWYESWFIVIFLKVRYFDENDRRSLTNAACATNHSRRPETWNRTCTCTTAVGLSTVKSVKEGSANRPICKTTCSSIQVNSIKY